MLVGLVGKYRCPSACGAAVPHKKLGIRSKIVMRARMTQIQETQKAGLFGLAKSNKVKEGCVSGVVGTLQD